MIKLQGGVTVCRQVDHVRNRENKTIDQDSMRIWTPRMVFGPELGAVTKPSNLPQFRLLKGILSWDPMSQTIDKRGRMGLATPGGYMTYTLQIA